MHIIVTGIPASGKSSIGKAMAAALGLELLDKDDILEAMFESGGKSGGAGTVEIRRRLSRNADEILRQRALESNGAVIVSWWRHPNSSKDTGTPIEWLSSLDGRVVQLHCNCDPKVAAQRFQSRSRHPGHLDQLKTFDEILASFQEFEALGRIDFGIPVIEVDTEERLDESALCSRILAFALDTKWPHKMTS